MADLVQTPANVQPGAGAQRVAALNLAGEALDAGEPVYKKTADNRWYRGDCDTATAPDGGKLHPPEAEVKGFTLNPAAIGQPVAIQSGGEIDLGAALTPGMWYALSKNAGKVCPITDFLAAQTPPENVVYLGYAKTAAVLVIKLIVADVVL
jgi:hypothetical protein